MRRFDAIVIGAGQAGPPLAVRLAGAGMQVALVERWLVGGTCVNTGCTPTKTLIASAYAAHLARTADTYGLRIPAVEVDFPKVKTRADRVARASRESVTAWLRGTAGVTLLEGQARFESPDTVRVADDLLHAPRIFLNVGGRANVPDFPGIRDVPFLTNTTLLGLDRLPRHLVVVGGSYVGLEFAQMFRRFGADVTVVEKAPHLVSREDADVSEAIRGILAREGITVRTRAECIRLAPDEQGVRVGVECPEGPPAAIGSHVLLAVGRRPNTDDLGLDRAGVRTDARGYVTVDEGLATNVPGIWALGDCNGRGAFTHTSYDDYEILAANLLDGAHLEVKARIPAYALYIDPPLGRVGMTLAQARASGRRILVGERPMTRVSRAVEKAETQGFMRVVVDAQTRRILGAAILGPGGDEAIHGVIDMMTADAPIDLYRRAVPIHPTVSELIPTVLGELREAT